MNILSSIPRSLKHPFTSVFWSDVSNIMNDESNPILSMNLLSIFTHIEWNVPIQMSFAASPIRFVILSFISFAALFVKVIASMSHGFAPSCSIMYAILCVSTFVFPGYRPEPG